MSYARPNRGGRKWLREHRADAWYRMAKREGWRSRASYKLIQLDERHQIIHLDDRVIDLGAAPGGWSQVAVELVGPEGLVVGVDLDKIEPLEGATFLRGDMTRDHTIARTLEAVGGVADVVISDMSPNISGNYATDHARSIYLVEAALSFAEKVLVQGGNFACKVFDGDMTGDFIQAVKLRFNYAKITSPPASRDSSSEVYVVGKDFRGPAAYPPLHGDPGWQEGDEIPPSRRRERRQAADNQSDEGAEPSESAPEAGAKPREDEA